MSRSNRPQYILNLIEHYGKLGHNDLLTAMHTCSEQIIMYHVSELIRIGLIKKDGNVYAMAR